MSWFTLLQLNQIPRFYEGCSQGLGVHLWEFDHSFVVQKSCLNRKGLSLNCSYKVGRIKLSVRKARSIRQGWESLVWENLTGQHLKPKEHYWNKLKWRPQAISDSPQKWVSGEMVKDCYKNTQKQRTKGRKRPISSSKQPFILSFFFV